MDKSWLAWQGVTMCDRVWKLNLFLSSFSFTSQSWTLDTQSSAASATDILYLRYLEGIELCMCICLYICIYTHVNRKLHWIHIVKWWIRMTSSEFCVKFWRTPWLPLVLVGAGQWLAAPTAVIGKDREAQVCAFQVRPRFLQIVPVLRLWFHRRQPVAEHAGKPQQIRLSFGGANKGLISCK